MATIAVPTKSEEEIYDMSLGLARRLSSGAAAGNLRFLDQRHKAVRAQNR